MLRIESKLRKAYRTDNKIIATAKKEGTKQDQLYDLEQSLNFQNRPTEHERDQIRTRYICLKARRLGVPLPDHSDESLWEESNVIGGWQLTDKGFDQLRAAIRKEKNERWHYFELRTKVIVTLATSLTGLVGALIGWAAFWK